MTRAVVVLAAGIASLCAIATTDPAQARPRNPWPWPSESPASPGPLYTYRGVYAPDALWDAYLRSGAVAPYVYPTYPDPAAFSDRTIIRVWSRGGPRWHHRHHRHRD